MSAAVLSLGSNIGDRSAVLTKAVGELGATVRAVSAIYRTPPWGPVRQNDFHNVVVLVEDENTDAAGWLLRCLELERRAGRERTVRWGPRTLDADVITVDGLRSSEPALTLPHPRAAERAFVLVPWAEIDPAAELPGFGPVDQLIARLPAEVAQIRLVGQVERGHYAAPDGGMHRGG